MLPEEWGRGRSWLPLGRAQLEGSCISQSSSEKENHIHIYYKQLVHTAMEAEKSQCL